MSGLTQAVRNFRNIWSHGDDDYNDDEADFAEENEAPASAPRPSQTSYAQNNAPAPQPTYGGSGSSGVRRLRSVAPSPLRAREKNIYTLRPKTQEDAAIAADALKAGDAVIINLEEVERSKAVRIIDFMSGVCYGLEGQGHAMKLGDLIFLYTPPEFEITSDETDYGENPDFFFRDVEHPPKTAAQNATAQNANVQNVAMQSAAPVSPLNAAIAAQREALQREAARASQSQNAPQSSTGSASPTSQPTPQQSFSPQSYTAERRPWER